MDREILRTHLEMAERHVAQGEQHLAQKRRIVQQLERGGHPTETSRSLLSTFEQLQDQHVADRDRLIAKLREKTRFSSPY